MERIRVLLIAPMEPTQPILMRVLLQEKRIIFTAELTAAFGRLKAVEADASIKNRRKHI